MNIYFLLKSSIIVIYCIYLTVICCCRLSIKFSLFGSVLCMVLKLCFSLSTVFSTFVASILLLIGCQPELLLLRPSSVMYFVEHFALFFFFNSAPTVTFLVPFPFLPLIFTLYSWILQRLLIIHQPCVPHILKMTDILALFSFSGWGASLSVSDLVKLPSPISFGVPS